MTQPSPASAEPDLDKDVAAVRAILNDPARSSQVRQLLQDPKVTLEDFRKGVPLAFIRLALITRSDFLQPLLQGLQPSQRPEVEGVAQLLVREFGKIADHPLVLGLLNEYAVGLTTGEAPLPLELGRGFEQIGRVTSTPLLVGVVPNLIPMIKVSFFGTNGKLIFDSVLSWPNLLSVVGAILNHCGKEMGRARPLFDNKQLAWDDDAMKKSLQPFIEGSLELKKQIEAYGLLPKPDAATLPDRPSTVDKTQPTPAAAQAISQPKRARKAGD